MPLYEFLCGTCGQVGEFYLRHWYSPDPACSACGGAQSRLASRFGVVFTGIITEKYKDRKKEYSHGDGVWCYPRDSQGKSLPNPVYIETHQQMREFCKQEGIYDPTEVPRNMQMGSDGKTVSSIGMPGQWAGCDPRLLVPSRVWEMDKSLTSLHGKDPVPVASGPPCTITAVDAATVSAQFGSMEG